jgi:hypothetical protein
MNEYIDTNIKIVQVEEDSTPIGILKDLIEFIEENDVKDETANDGDGHIDEWRSIRFNHLINQAKEVITKGGNK